jgi:hypothetical protein
VAEVEDKYACAELIQAWGLYRDQGKWSELLGTFTSDGQISVSWFSGAFSEFVAQCRQAFQAGQRSKHHIFPSVVRIAGQRALAETNIVILVRQKIGGVLTDMSSYARFLDRLEQRGGAFKSSDLSIYPEAYRYMAARLAAAGRTLAPVVYRDGSPHTTQLYLRYERWLDGSQSLA